MGQRNRARKALLTGGYQDHQEFLDCLAHGGRGLLHVWAGQALAVTGVDLRPPKPIAKRLIADTKRLRTFLIAYPGVTAIRELLVTFLGPFQVWVIARLDIDDDLRGDQLKSLVRGIESGLKHESENIYRVDVVPIGGAKATP